MSKSLATVLIPVERPEPTPLERISLDQTLRVLGKHPITLQAPVGLDVSWYENYCKGRATVQVERFEWRDKDELGRLMLSPDFYARFRAYEYMLVCQLDAFVFRDQLEAFCKLGYDYIGAHACDLDRPQVPDPGYLGSGGFSLRGVESFHRITDRFAPCVGLYLWLRRLRRLPVRDDDFIARHFRKLSRKFDIASPAVARKFGAACQGLPGEEMPLAKAEASTLPFGILGLSRFSQADWIARLRELGYGVGPVASARTHPYNFFHERHRHRTSS